MSSLQYDPKTDALWLSTSIGISKIDLGSMQAYHFDGHDGVETNLNESGGTLLANDGALYFAGRNGFNRFFSETTKPDLSSYKVMITKLLMSGEVVKPSENSNSVLSRSILTTRKLTLTHSQNSFGFEFSALRAPRSKHIDYGYKLDGYEENWTYVSGDKRFANYTNIPPGHYAFRVKGKNKHNEWGSEESLLEIIITPPWWDTLPAYMLYLILCIAAIILIIRLRTHALVSRAKSLEASVRARTADLAIEKQKVEFLLERKVEEIENVSHEFKTPLTLILGPIQQLLQEPKLAPYVQPLKLIERNGHRLYRMVEQLLDIETQRIDSIRPNVNQDLTALVKSAVMAFEPVAKKKGVQLKLEKVEQITREFPQDAFEKVLLNLVSNAIKYTPAGGQAWVSLSMKSKEEMLLEVRDTGIGIDASLQNNVFERFQRVHEVTPQNSGGSGIGLSLVKAIVQAQNGRISLVSELGVGTCVSVYFPIHVPEATRVATQTSLDQEALSRELMNLDEGGPSQLINQEANDKRGANGSCILLIDDNPEMLNYLNSLFQDEYLVMMATNGQEGLEKAVSQLPDLIVSDVMMPIKDGFQLSEALKQNTLTEHIPIVLLTAKGDRNSRLRGLSRLVDDYVAKPFNTEELRCRISNLLEVRKILKRRYSLELFDNRSVQDTEVGAKHSEQQAFLSKLNKLLEQEYTDMDLRIGHLSSLMGVSERQLFRKLKGTVDMTPTEYLRNFRLMKAVEMLESGEKPSLVSLTVGFSSASYFNKCFKAQFGNSPTDHVKMRARKAG